MSIAPWLAFAVASAILLVIPGPTVLLVVSYALGQGWRAALPVAVGGALGDFTADDAGLGFEKGSLVFAGLLALVALAHFFTKAPKPILFWAAYVLTRPLGATLGDTLTKSHEQGGLALGRFQSTAAIAAAMIVLIAATRLRKRT